MGKGPFQELFCYIEVLNHAWNFKIFANKCRFLKHFEKNNLCNERILEWIFAL